jgi:molybdenum cofactor cytidylyltransferase
VISAILLAAGTSSRFEGKNKLLSKYKNKVLFKYAFEELVKSKISKVIVVLGKNRNDFKKLISINQKVQVLYNKNYKKGMSTSIKEGLKKIKKPTKGFLICLSDMPKIKASIYNKILKKFSLNKNNPVVPMYNKKRGNPVCFPYNFKRKLMKLKGDAGAKYILKKTKCSSINVKSKSILIDFDRRSDFKN